MGVNRGWLFMVCLFSILVISSNTGVYGAVAAPKFSMPAGLYEEEFTLELTTGSNEEIYYTLNGGIPVIGEKGTYHYEEPFSLSFTPLRDRNSSYFCGTIIRAMSVDTEGNQSDVGTASYLLSPNIMKKYQLPILSIIADPDDLYDVDTGILFRANTRNKGREWEIPVHIEYFDQEGQMELDMNVGMRLHGAASRDWSFKSFRLYARTEYDANNWMDYPFFEDSYIQPLIKSGPSTGQELTKFKRIIIRNGGNDGTAWDGTFIRDILAQSLMSDTNLDLQSFSPTVTFLNGEFYGIHNIQERQDEKYIEAHYEIPEEDIVIYEFSYNHMGEQTAEISHGTEEDRLFYQTLYEFVRDQDMSLDENYNKVLEWMDIENYIDYQIMNIYLANGDWPGNNMKAWRMRTDYNQSAEYGKDGRLRFIVYDLDFAFGLYEPGHLNITTDSIQHALRTGGREWPNPDGSTVLFRNLLENDTFQRSFIQRYLDLMNTNFYPEDGKVLVDQFSSPYQYAMDEYKRRHNTMGEWEKNLGGIKTFIDRRSIFARRHLNSEFKLGDEYTIQIDGIGSTPQEMGGKIILNTIELTRDTKGVRDGSWSGVYFTNFSTKIKVIPEPGYEFISWGSGIDYTATEIEGVQFLGEGEIVVLQPTFEKIEEEILVEEVKGVNGDSITSESEKTSEPDYFLIIGIILLLISGFFGYTSIRNRKKNKKGM